MNHNITTTENGFNFQDESYTFSTTQLFDENENIIEVDLIISTENVLIATDKGVIYLDLSCTIKGVEYTNINLFVEALTNF
jgi:hypothetical protein